MTRRSTGRARDNAFSDDQNASTGDAPPAPVEFECPLCGDTVSAAYKHNVLLDGMYVPRPESTGNTRRLHRNTSSTSLHVGCSERLLPDLVDDETDSESDSDNESDDENEELDASTLQLLAWLVWCRDKYSLSCKFVDELKGAFTKYAITQDTNTAKKLSRKFGIPRAEIEAAADLYTSPFKGWETEKLETKQFNAEFKPVRFLEPQTLGYDERGRAERVYYGDFKGQLNDLLSCPELYMDTQRTVPDDGEWSYDVRHGGLWKAHPMVRAGVKPWLVSMWMDGAEITNPIGPRRGKKKFIFAFWKLLNSGPAFQSSHSNYRLAFVCHEKVFKKYGACAVVSGCRDNDDSWIQDGVSWGSQMREGVDGECQVRHTLIRRLSYIVW